MVRIIISICILLSSLSATSQIQLFHAHNQSPTCDYILDTYTGAVAAYSFRKLSSSYTGPCVRILKAGTTDSTDIGFLNCYVDTAAIKTFLGSAAGEVLWWYDQTGNGNHADEPSIGSKTRLGELGSFFYHGNKIAIRGNASAGLYTPSFSAKAAFSVVKVNTQQAINYLFGSNSPLNGGFYNGSFGGVNGIGAFDGSNIRSLAGEDLNRHLAYWNINGGNIAIAKDGAAASSFAFSITTFTVSGIMSRRTNTLGIDGDVQELIFFTNEQSAAKAAIEANINTYYSIY